MLMTEKMALEKKTKNRGTSFRHKDPARDESLLSTVDSTEIKLTDDHAARGSARKPPAPVRAATQCTKTAAPVCLPAGKCTPKIGPPAGHFPNSSSPETKEKENHFEPAQKNSKTPRKREWVTQESADVPVSTTSSLTLIELYRTFFFRIFSRNEIAISNQDKRIMGWACSVVGSE